MFCYKYYVLIELDVYLNWEDYFILFLGKGKSDSGYGSYETITYYVSF